MKTASESDRSAFVIGDYTVQNQIGLIKPASAAKKIATDDMIEQNAPSYMAVTGMVIPRPTDPSSAPRDRSIGKSVGDCCAISCLYVTAIGAFPLTLFLLAVLRLERR